MTKAEEIIRRYEKLRSERSARRSNLRFGYDSIKVSDIANQYWCEKKVELDIVGGVKVPQEMIKGQMGHELITALAVPIPRDDALKDIWQKRERAKPFENVSVIGSCRGVPIVGEVDQVWFKEGEVILVVERKFRDRLVVFRHDNVQAKLYCLLLDELGFNTSYTKWKICIFKRSCIDCRRLTNWSCPIFEPERERYRCDTGEVKSLFHDYDKSDALIDLDWALNFWLMQREATPTRNSAKCQACPWRESCNSSLA